MKARLKGARKLRREQEDRAFELLPEVHKQTVERFNQMTADLSDGARETLLMMLLANDTGDEECVFSEDMAKMIEPLRAMAVAVEEGMNEGSHRE